jgi:hypothetical protein
MLQPMNASPAVSRPSQVGGDRSVIANQLTIQPSAVGPAAPDEDTIV